MESHSITQAGGHECSSATLAHCNLCLPVSNNYEEDIECSRHREMINVCHKKYVDWARWLTPVIPALWEAKARWRREVSLCCPAWSQTIFSPQAPNVLGLQISATARSLVWSIALLLRPECSGMTMAHCNLHLLGLSNYPASASQLAGITGAYHYIWLLFVFLVETGFHLVGQAGLEPLASSYPLVLASQGAGITDEVLLCHLGWNAVARCELTVTSASQFQEFLLPQPARSWDHKSASPAPAQFFCIFSREGGFTMLSRLVLSSWPPVIHPPRPPK
ncbi:hypothetical protein AAY473_034361 [Plecturocebus cupreus]